MITFFSAWFSVITRWLPHLFPRQCALCRLTIPVDKTTHALSHLWCSTCIKAFISTEPRCQHCGLTTLYTVQQCGRCLSDPPSWDRLYCINSYQYPISKVAQDFKYHGQYWLVFDLAALLKSQIPNPAPECIPVPMHWKRLLFRGFNQSHSLAFQLVKQYQHQNKSVALNNHVFRRTHATVQQKGLDKKQRQRNLRGVFFLMQPPQNKHVALVDDVVTTGSTLEPLCRALRKAGVERIDVYCLCRTPEPK